MPEADEPSSADQQSKVGDKRVDVVVAEFNALRNEIAARTTIQITLLGTGLTAIGVVVSFAIGSTGKPSLFALVSPVSALVLFLQANQSYKITLIGDYIRSAQFEYLRKILGEDLPSWEHSIQRRASRFSGYAEAALEGSIDLALTAAGGACLFFADGVAIWARACLGGLLLVAVAARVCVGFRERV